MTNVIVFTESTTQILHHVHAANCADLNKRHYLGKDVEATDLTTKQAITEDLYSGQIAGGEGTWEEYAASDIKFFPCANLAGE